MSTATKKKPGKRAAKLLPPKAETAMKPPKRPKPAKPYHPAVGETVEFKLTEGEPRPAGDAVVLFVEPLPASKGSWMAKLDVTNVINGDPDAIRNPDGELWAQAGELFKAGTRDKLAVCPPGTTAEGLQASIDAASDFALTPSTTTYFAESAEAASELKKHVDALAACIIFRDATGGRYDVILLSGKQKAAARKAIMHGLLGREPKHDEYGLFDVREAFQKALGIDGDCSQAERDERVAKAAQHLVESIAVDQHADQPTTVAGSGEATDADSSSIPAAPEAAQGEPKADAAGSGQASNEPTTSAAGADDFMAKQAKKVSKSRKGKQHSSGNANGKPKKERGMSLVDAAFDVLSKARKPLTAEEITSKVIERGLWSTKGKTPAATTSARLYTEIAEKGSKSRFKKVKPGVFDVK